MNASAQQHLAKATEFIAKGEEFYRKAAAEIVAAKKDDPGLSNREIARKIGKNESYVRRLLDAASRAAQGGEFVVDWDSGSNVRSEVVAKTLRDSTPAQVAALLDAPEIRANVTKALDTHYRERAQKAATQRQERRAEERGGNEVVAEIEQRQRKAELVNVVRGAVSALRFAASQAKGLDLVSDDTGAAEELTDLVEEIVGFGSMLKEYLAGRSITDEDIAELIGGR